MKVRTWRSSPLYHNIREYFHTTRVGRSSKQLDDYCHRTGRNLGEWIVKKSRTNVFSRRFIYPCTIICGFIYGYVGICNFWSANLYERKFNHGVWQPWDYSTDVIREWCIKDKIHNVQYSTMQKTLLFEMMEQKGNIDTIDWLLLGQHFARAGEEEVAYQCFHMAHLL